MESFANFFSFSATVYDHSGGICAGPNALAIAVLSQLFRAVAQRSTGIFGLWADLQM